MATPLSWARHVVKHRKTFGGAAQLSGPMLRQGQAVGFRAVEIRLLGARLPGDCCYIGQSWRESKYAADFEDG